MGHVHLTKEQMARSYDLMGTEEEGGRLCDEVHECEICQQIVDEVTQSRPSLMSLEEVREILAIAAEGSREWRQKNPEEAARREEEGHKAIEASSHHQITQEKATHYAVNPEDLAEKEAEKWQSCLVCHDIIKAACEESQSKKK